MENLIDTLMNIFIFAFIGIMIASQPCRNAEIVPS